MIIGIDTFQNYVVIMDDDGSILARLDPDLAIDVAEAMVVNANIIESKIEKREEREKEDG